MGMMTIKMLASRYGVEGGFDLTMLKEGEIYTVARGLACAFIQSKAAVLIEDHITLPAPKDHVNWRNPPQNPATLLVKGVVL